MKRDVKGYLEDELKFYTKELKKELEKLSYLIINFGEDDIAVQTCYEQIKFLGSKKRKLLKLLEIKED